MRRLTYVVVILAALYGGYWVVGSRAVNAGATSALAALQGEGVRVDYTGLETTGFPSRFDTTLTEPRIFDPTSGFGWAGDFLQVFALSYQPNKVIVIAPPEQVITTPAGPLTVKAEGLRASGSVGLSTDAPLTSAIVESGPGSVLAATGETVGFEKLLIAVKPTDAPNDYEAFVEILGLLPPGLLTPVEMVRFDAVATLNKPLDRHLGEGAEPQILSLDIKETRISWGGGVITAQGPLTVDAQGYPEGEIAVIATGWQAMIDSAVTAGLVKPEVAPTWQNMGTMLANGSTDIALPLVFRNGMMALGPLPLGPAPRLR